MKKFEDIILEWVHKDDMHGKDGQSSVDYMEWLSELKHCVSDVRDFRPAKVAKETYTKVGYCPQILTFVSCWCNLLANGYVFVTDDTSILDAIAVFRKANKLSRQDLGMSEEIAEFLRTFSMAEVYDITGALFALFDICGREDELPESFVKVHRELCDTYGFDWYILVCPVS